MIKPGMLNYEQAEELNQIIRLVRGMQQFSVAPPLYKTAGTLGQYLVGINQAALDAGISTVGNDTTAGGGGTADHSATTLKAVTTTGLQIDDGSTDADPSTIQGLAASETQMGMVDLEDQVMGDGVKVFTSPIAVGCSDEAWDGAPPFPGVDWTGSVYVFTETLPYLIGQRKSSNSWGSSVLFPSQEVQGVFLIGSGFRTDDVDVVPFGMSCIHYGLKQEINSTVYATPAFVINQDGGDINGESNDWLSCHFVAGSIVEDESGNDIHVPFIRIQSGSVSGTGITSIKSRIELEGPGGVVNGIYHSPTTGGTYSGGIITAWNTEADPTDVTGTAGASWGTTEQDLLNDVASRLNTVLNTLRNMGIYV